MKRQFTMLLVAPLFWVLMLGLVLRIPLLNGSFWLDEAAQALESSRPLSQQLQIKDDFQPPLIHYLVHFLMIVSSSEWFLRLGAALIPSLITIWGTYQIGVKLKDQQTGYIAALLLATSSFHIFYSQELRPYSLPTMFGVLSWLVLLHIFQPSSVKKKNDKNVGSSTSWSRWLLFTIISILGFYSSYLYPFLFVVQLGCGLLMSRQYWKQLVAVCLGVGLAFAVWLPGFTSQLQAGQLLRTTLPGWDKVVSFSQAKAIALVGGKFVFGVLNLDTNWQYMSVFGLVCMCLGTLLWLVFSSQLKHKKRELDQSQVGIILLLAWAVVPVLLAWCVSFFVPILQAKRVLFCLPGLYLLCAVLITPVLSVIWQRVLKHQSLQLQLLEWSAPILLLLLLGINTVSTLSYYFVPQYHREDWRSLEQQLLVEYPPSSSVVVFAFPGPFASWVWYDHNQYQVYPTGVIQSDQAPQLEEMKKLTTYRYILMFDYLRDLTDPGNRIPARLQSLGYNEVDRITPTTPIGIVHVFSRKENIMSRYERWN